MDVRLYPVEEPIEERIQIRRYMMGGGQTCNTAEYAGLMNGLDLVRQHVLSTSLRKGQLTTLGCTLMVKGDSELVIRQMQGVYRAEKLSHLHEKASRILSEIENLVDEIQVTFEHIPREKNGAADKLANEALDAKRSWTTITSNHDHQHLYGHS